MQGGEQDSEREQSTSIEGSTRYSTPIASSTPNRPTATNINNDDNDNNRSSTTSRNSSSTAPPVPFTDPRGAISTPLAPPLRTISHSTSFTTTTNNNNNNNSYIDPPPPPYPGLSRPLLLSSQTDTEEPIIRHQTSSQRNVNVNRIPTITFQDDTNNQYTSIMNCSLFLLVLCLIICNITSLVFTVPAVICSWTSVRANMNYRHERAMKSKKIAVVCNWMSVGAFVILFIIGCLVLGIYLLLKNNYLSVNF